MSKNRWSEEDLRALLEYIASNPAIPFPNLTIGERERLIKEVIEQAGDLEKGAVPVIDLLKANVDKLRGY